MTTVPISVAIPTYGRGAILLETLSRLLQMEPRAAEIVVVDQTREHSPDVAARLGALHDSGEIVLVTLDQPSIPRAMNASLLRATSPLVLFLDDDVEVPAGLAGAHARAHGSRGVWAVVGQVLQPGEEPAHFPEAALHAGPIRDLEFRFNHDTPGDVENVMAGNLSVDCARALSIGGFDENFVGAAYRFESDFARRIVAAGGRIRFEPTASLRHLKIPTGGGRALGSHLTDASPAHSVGDYYFALHHTRGFPRYAARRLARNVATRFHATHPWTIPLKLVGELRGMAEAWRLYRSGRCLLRS